MKELIDCLKENGIIIIKKQQYVVKTKTWYSIEEDKNTIYIKCELSNNKVLVIIPADNLTYIGEVIPNMKYEKISNDKIRYNNIIFNKTGEGNQFIKKIEFGNKNEVEGRCLFEDYEASNNIISLGVLKDKGDIRADVYASIINVEDIQIEKEI